MKFLKKYWYLFAIALFTLGLGVLVFITSQQLAQRGPVAPNVPEEEPEAAARACKLEFTIEVSSECGSTCTKNSECPNDNTCSSGECVLTSCLAAGATCDAAKCAVVTPTPTPTATPTPTPTPSPTPTATPTPTPTPPSQSSCNQSCTVNGDCGAGLACVNNACRNPSCTERTNCQCSTVVLPTPTPQTVASCNQTCTINSDCDSGLACVDSACRNPSCTEQAGCSCPVAEAPTPKVPVSGTGPSVLGATVIAGGLFILLLGLAL